MTASAPVLTLVRSYKRGRQTVEAIQYADLAEVRTAVQEFAEKHGDTKGVYFPAKGAPLVHVGGSGWTQLPPGNVLVRETPPGRKTPVFNVYSAPRFTSLYVAVTA